MRIDFPSILGLSQQADPLRLPDGMCTFVRNSRPNNGNEVTTLNVPVGQTRTFVCRRFIGGAGAHVCWSVL